jgi:C_GCAxxG_C_C family probable redox protein
MTPDEMRQRAIDIFTKRFHCSQAVLLAGQEKMNTVNEDVIRAVGLFAGGLSGTCRVCGALTGGVALISSLFSRGNLGQKEDPRMWSMGHRFITEFEKLTADYGGTDCSDIARVNWADRQEVKEFYSNPESRRKICVQLVGDTACALGKLLEELPR